MDKQEIRRILGSRPQRVIAPGQLTPAAVLLPLAFDGRDDRVFFIQRSTRVLYHKGQVSFPGGGREKSDADLLATALRESDEEIGLRPGDVQVLGRLDDQATVSGFVITPWVGTFPWPYAFRRQETEVDEVFSLPLAHLMDDRLCRQGENIDPNATAPGYSFECQGRHIWGATARILKQFLDALRVGG
jgi:8-oxo-dGTP pyrophosphatase MutT (NUDIX family)